MQQIVLRRNPLSKNFRAFNFRIPAGYPKIFERQKFSHLLYPHMHVCTHVYTCMYTHIHTQAPTRT